jgi:hypothetical protein
LGTGQAAHEALILARAGLGLRRLWGEANRVRIKQDGHYHEVVLDDGTVLQTGPEIMSELKAEMEPPIPAPPMPKRVYKHGEHDQSSHAGGGGGKEPGSESEGKPSGGGRASDAVVRKLRDQFSSVKDRVDSAIGENFGAENIMRHLDKAEPWIKERDFAMAADEIAAAIPMIAGSLGEEGDDHPSIRALERFQESLENMADRFPGEDEKRYRRIRKAVPPDVDRETFERCIEHVMGQGHDKSSAFAICTAGGAGAGKRTGKAEREYIRDETGRFASTGAAGAANEALSAGERLERAAVRVREEGLGQMGMDDALLTDAMAAVEDAANAADRADDVQAVLELTAIRNRVLEAADAKDLQRAAKDVLKIQARLATQARGERPKRKEASVADENAAALAAYHSRSINALPAYGRHVYDSMRNSTFQMFGKTNDPKSETYAQAIARPPYLTQGSIRSRSGYPGWWIFHRAGLEVPRRRNFL